MTSFLQDGWGARQHDRPFCRILSTTVLTFLGTEMDPNLGISRLPSGKLAELRLLIISFLAKRKALLCKFQVLLGHLNFTCGVVVSGQAFCIHLYAATSITSATHHFIHMIVELKEDLEVRRQFLMHFNGVCWQCLLCLRADLQVHSDAAGGVDQGVYWN